MGKARASYNEMDTYRIPCSQAGLIELTGGDPVCEWSETEDYEVQTRWQYTCACRRLRDESEDPIEAVAGS